MNASDTQIVEAYEATGQTPEVIASNLGYELDAVKLILMQHSTKFRAENSKLVANDDPPLFDNNVLNRAKGVMEQLLYSDESDAIKYKAAKFVINEAKGRHDMNKNIAKLGIGIAELSDRMTRALQANDRATKTINLKPQDVVLAK